LTALTFSGSFSISPSGSGGATVSINSNIEVTGAPGGTISGSQQLRELGYATTGSNTFTNTQILTGSLFVTGTQVTISGSVWAQSLQLPYSWSLILPLQEGFMLAGSPQGYLTAIRTSSLSGVGGGASSGGPFTQTGSYYSAVSDILISGSVKISGSISASAFAITTPGTPEIASSTDIILNAANSVKIASSSLKLASFTNNQTASVVAENGALIYNSSKNKIGLYANGQWVYDMGLFPYDGRAEITGSLLVQGSTLQTGNNTLIGNTTLSGSIEVSGSSNFRNSLFIITGSTFFTGSHEVKGNTTFSGSLRVSGSTYIEGDYYKNGNKQFNYISLINTGSALLSSATLYSASFVNGSSPYYVYSGFSLSGSSAGGALTKIVVANSGIYNLQYSFQLDTNDNQAASLYVWVAKNGTDLDYTNSIFGVANNGYSVPACNIVLQLTAGDHIELRYATQDTNLQLATVSSSLVPVRPIAPAIITTVTQVA
jgi:hypothetical protein